MENNYKDIMDFSGKNVVVTGGAGLIGSEICKAFSEFGATTIIADINQKDGEKLEKYILDSHQVAHFIKFNTTSEKDIIQMIMRIKKDFKKIDVWVNCAYPRTNDWGKPFEEIPYDSWRKNVDMQLNSCFLCCQYCLEEMKKNRSGVIINFSSIYGSVGSHFPVYEGTGIVPPAAYSAIKGGINNFSRYLAAYYAEYGIRINVISPGGIFNHQKKRFVDNFSKITPMGRMGMPHEIAMPVLFLASEAASYITGHVLIVDGGYTIW